MTARLRSAVPVLLALAVLATTIPSAAQPAAPPAAVPATQPAAVEAAVEAAVGRLADRLKFLEAERPELNLPESEVGKLGFNLQRDAQGRLTSGSVGFSYNLTPETKTKDQPRPIVENAWAMRVYFSIARPDGRPTAADRANSVYRLAGLPHEHIAPDGKSISRDFDIPGTE